VSNAPPPYTVSPRTFAPFLPVRPCFSTVLGKFSQFFFLRVSPPGGCHPGQSPRPSPTVTPLLLILQRWIWHWIWLFSLLNDCKIMLMCILETMSETLLRALRVPTAKYDAAQTTSHEYGWYSQPLVGSAQFLLFNLLCFTAPAIRTVMSCLEPSSVHCITDQSSSVVTICSFCCHGVQGGIVRFSLGGGVSTGYDWPRTERL